MKPIRKEELYENLSQFLKGKGIELKEGTYPRGIQASCSLLADVINMSQKGITRARSEIDRSVERVRQVVHQNTAPKPPVQKPGKKAARAAKPKARRPKRGASKR